MGKKPLQSKPMSPLAVVDQAAAWSDELLKRECRGPGDLPEAMRRLEVRYGIPARVFWAFRYRKPKDVAGSVLVRLYAAYQAERMRQLKMLENELAKSKAIAGACQPVVESVAAVLASAATPAVDEER